MKLKTKIYLFLCVLTLIWLVQCTNTVYNSGVEMFNSNQQYTVDLAKKTNEQVSTYDANYLAFKQKSSIAAINKETFIVVTDIIMSNRKDGQQLAWKWVTENQPIPYTEFTNFYKDLSTFTEQQYEVMASIEAQKQTIVANQNILIKKYPNNIINWYLKIKPLDYKFGYLSDSTKQLFKIQ